MALFSKNDDSFFNISSFGITKHLLSTIEKENLPDGLDKVSSLNEYNNHLSDKLSWNNYKKNLHQTIEKLKSEKNIIYNRQVELMYDADLTTEQRIKNRTILEDQQFEKEREINNLKIKEGICEKIDKLILNKSLQELLLAQEELHQYYPSFIFVQKHPEHNQKKIEELIHRDRHLQDLLITISDLKKLNHDKTMSMKKHDSTETVIETTSSLMDIHSSSAKMIFQANKFSHYFADVDSSGHVTHSAELLKALPIVSGFIKGLANLRDAYKAYYNREDPFRTIKLASALFGGLVFIGVGIVSSLFLASIGLLGTASAIYVTPIVLAAAAIGVTSVALFRDSVMLHASRVKVQQLELKLREINNDFIRAKEIIVSTYLNHLVTEHAAPEEKNSLDLLKDIQTQINHKRHELYLENHKSPVNERQISILKNDLSHLNAKRNELITTNSNLKIAINEKIRTDPRFMRIQLQKNNLDQSLVTLKAARDSAKRKVKLSVFAAIGIGLAFAAVLATGLGALILAAAATAILIGVTAVKLYDKFNPPFVYTPEKKSSPVVSSVVVHNSELAIENELQHHHHDEIAHALMHQVISNERSVTQDVPQKKNAVEPNQNQPEEVVSDNERKDAKIKPH